MKKNDLLYLAELVIHDCPDCLNCPKCPNCPNLELQPMSNL